MLHFQTVGLYRIPPHFLSPIFLPDSSVRLQVWSPAQQRGPCWLSSLPRSAAHQLPRALGLPTLKLCLEVLCQPGEGEGHLGALAGHWLCHLPLVTPSQYTGLLANWQNVLLSLPVGTPLPQPPLGTDPISRFQQHKFWKCSQPDPPPSTELKLTFRETKEKASQIRDYGPSHLQHTLIRQSKVGLIHALDFKSCTNCTFYSGH